MPTLLITATRGQEDSSRAGMPFFVAKGAKEAGIDVGIVLALDATVLVKPEIRKPT
jgi:predicted peroxiredoxin